MASTCHLDPERTRRRLAEVGTTQTALAANLGLELRTLQRWFAGRPLRIEDAERIAAALGVGTGELCTDALPQAASTFGALRTALALLRRSDGPMAQAVRTTLEHFEFVDAFLSFDAHPRGGYVRRIAPRVAPAHGFVVVRVSPREREPTVFRFAAQVGSRFRYEFGEVRVTGGQVRLVEHFHTRSMRAPLRQDGSFDVHVWVPGEMQELVITSERDFVLEASDGPPDTTFRLHAPTTRNAVCFRPSAMHLRKAGLPAVFDRIEGVRDQRVDEGMARD